MDWTKKTRGKSCVYLATASDLAYTTTGINNKTNKKMCTILKYEYELMFGGLL